MKKRSLSLVLVLSMCLSMFCMGTQTATATAAGSGEETLSVKELEGREALHFIIRHWHSRNDDDGSQFQGDSLEQSNNRYFVVVEGYIVPTTEEERRDGDDYTRNEDNFHFYLVYQDGTETCKEIRNGGYVDNSSYVDQLDHKEGTITFSTNPLYKDDGETEAEVFSSYSVSAGHSAVTTNDKDRTLTIEYDKYVHLVKAHAFYVKTTVDTENGTPDDTVFGDGGIGENPEHDTAMVYTYTEDIKDASDVTIHKKGEIIKVTVNGKEEPFTVFQTDEAGNRLVDEKGYPLKDEEALKEAGITQYLDKIAVTKAYDSSAGLHTDKTATALYVQKEDEDGRLLWKDEDGNMLYETDDGIFYENGSKYTKPDGDDEYAGLKPVMVPDGRTFNLDLEAWYSEGYAPQVGLILDASGSMVFSSDKPDQINVLDRLGIMLDASGQYVHTDGTSIVAAEEPDLYSIAQKIAGLTAGTANPYIYPQHDNLIGYYSFTNGKPDPDPNGTRTWLNNSAESGKVASKLKGQADFSVGAFTFTVNTDADVTQGWPGDHSDLNFSADTGMNVLHSTSPSGIVLDVEPDLVSGLTVSFAVYFNPGSGAAGDIAELLYIGPMDGTVSAGGFYRAYCDINGGFHDNADSAFSGAFADTNRHVITLVFGDNSVTTYLDGNKASAVTKDLSLAEDGIRIIIDGIADDFKCGQIPNGSKTKDGYISIDDVFVYNTALDIDDVSKLYSTYNADKGTDNKAVADINKISSTTDLASIFLDEKELALLLDPNKTDNSLLSASGYSYFVLNGSNYEPLGYWEGGDAGNDADPKGVAKTKTGAILGSINFTNGNGTENETVSSNHSSAGWYHVSHAGNYSSHYVAYGTGKRLAGINGKSSSLTLTDSLGDDGDTKLTYKPNVDIPTQFYVDKNGNLRCFFNTKGTCSYVYELGDGQYIRTEALQRALGLFVTELDEYSPMARVSAVRFSTSNISNDRLNELVLLDWTDDPAESTGILSLERGDGTSLGRETSYRSLKNGGIEQYNYGLTGATSTWRGLQAYINVLEKYDNPYTDESNQLIDGVPKYIIIFTDGADTDIGKTDQVTIKEGSASRKVNSGDAAKALADYLKKQGYTIFTVLLDGDSMGDDEYNSAKNFLTSLSNGEHFYSVKNAKAALQAKGVDITGMNDADILTQVFVENILPEIAHPLTDYGMKNYLDPRFDLVDRTGTVWHLNADGKVVKVDSDGNTIGTIDVTNKTFGKNNNDWATITLSDVSDDVAQKPYLRYDESRDLYYLEWVKQTIPGSAIGANRLPVWNARVTIRAKDDFIGGNAVLTDGIWANMNYVYATKDTSPSSGSDRSTPGWSEPKEGGVAVAAANNTEYLSKGFPRVAVNVTPPTEDVELFQTIFMGETLDSDKLAQMIIDAAKDESIGTGAQYYWEYVGRYVNYINALYNGKIEGISAEEGQAIIERLNSLNRSGNSIPAEQPDSLEQGRMRIISNRMYELIQKGELTVDKLSELLIDSITEIPETPNTGEGGEKDGGLYPGVDKPDQDNKDLQGGRYLYIPYIYLPDDPQNPGNSTGSGTHMEDVIGYLFFHIDEKFVDVDDNNKEYPGYPTNPDRITTTNQTRMSRLTVSFMVRSATDRAAWNNKMAIQETKTGAPSENPADKVYGRDTTYKPAPGEAITKDIVVRGTFATYIFSGDVALQVELSADAVAALKDANVSTVTYTAQLWCTDTDELVGDLTATINVNSLKSGQTNYVMATVAYASNYASAEKVTDAYSYGLPLGTYTVKAGETAFTGGDGEKPIQFTVPKVLTVTSEYGDAAFNGALTDDEIIKVTDPETKQKEEQKLERAYHPGYAADLNAGANTATLGGGKNSASGIALLADTIESFETEGKVNARFGLFRATALPLGDLVISKTVTADTGVKLIDTDKKKDFTFHITLIPPEAADWKNSETIDVAYGTLAGVTDATAPSSAAGTVTFTKQGDGTYTGSVTLKHGQTATLKNLPAGSVYTVEEETVTGYEVNPLSGSGKIVRGTDKNKADFTNRKMTGDLTVEKKVTGSKGDVNKSFNFTVTLSDRSINGKYGDMTFTNGVATFALKHNQSITAKGLPAGVTYTVEETEADQDGYVTFKSGDTGTITDKQTAKATFTNQNLAGVTIKKDVVSSLADDHQKEFTFTVAIKDGNGNPVDRGYYYVTNADGTKSQINIADGDTFTLKDTESITIENLPANTTVTVTETENPDFTTSVTVTNGSGQPQTRNDNSASSTIILGSATKDDAILFEFTNTRKTGSLEVSKTVEGKGANTNKYFTFTVTLYKADAAAPFADDDIANVNYVVDGLTFSGGVASFALKHGGTKTITGIPAGLQYVVTESDNGGYTPASTGETGSITAGGTATAAFTNTYQTGSLKVSKTVNGDYADTTKEFSFTVTLTGSADDGTPAGAISGTYGGMTFSGGVASFTLADGDSLTASDLPAGFTYTVTETPAPGYTPTYSDNSSGTITTGMAEVAVTNTYGLTSASATPTVTKTLTGKTLADNDFTFEMTISSSNGGEWTYGDGDNPTKETSVTVKNKADGTVPFEKITFTKPGTYTVIIKEQVPRDTKGVAYDPREVTFIYVVEDNGSGQLGINQQKSTIPTDTTFTNAYTAQPAKVTPTVTKELKYGTLAGDDFAFTMTIAAETGSPADGYSYTGDYTAKNAANGSVTFGEISFTKAGTYKVTIHETNDGQTGIQYDSKTVTYTYTVKDDGNGQLYIEGGLPAAETFTNEAVGSLTVSKTVSEGDKTKDFTFTVTLTGVPAVMAEPTYTYGGVTFTRQEGNGAVTYVSDSFTLRDGGSKTFTGLPAGLGYTVTEAPAEGYIQTSAEDAQGTIEKGVTAEANFTNRAVYDLTVEKTVVGTMGDTAKSWEFTITLTPPTGMSLAGTYSYTGTGTVDGGSDGKITLTGNGPYEIKVGLTHNQTVTIQGLPHGTGYTVTETDANTDGYGTTVTGGATNNSTAGTASGTLNANAAVKFQNANPAGGVTIRKTVDSVLTSDKTESFTFKVTFSSDGRYAYTGSKTGTIASGDTIELANGEYIYIELLPVGTEVTVEELLENDDFITTVNGTPGKTATLTVPGEVDGKKQDITFEFENTRKTGDLKVSKTVTGSGGDKNRAFNFTVTLTWDRVEELDGKQFGDMTFSKNPDTGVIEAAFTLTDGQSLTATGLPIGITYTVTEADADQDGYTTTATGDTGEIRYNQTAAAQFVNHKDAPPPPPPPPSNPTGRLTVTNTVTGSAGEKDREFHYEVTIGGDTFTFTLKDGESWTSGYYPAGTAYTVTQTDANVDGYTTTVSANASGTIPGNQTVTVAFINNKEATEPGTDPDPGTDPEPETPPDDVPKTGDERRIGLWIFLMLVSLTGMVMLLSSQKRVRRVRFF